MPIIALDEVEQIVEPIVGDTGGAGCVVTVAPRVIDAAFQQNYASAAFTRRVRGTEAGVSAPHDDNIRICVHHRNLHNCIHN